MAHHFNNFYKKGSYRLFASGVPMKEGKTVGRLAETVALA